MDKECLPIWWLVNSLRYYLLGRSFTLCSAHAPLQWFHRMKDAHITWWYLALQPEQSVGEECQSVMSGCSTKVEKETVSSVSLQ